jgi:hypothetical protein
MSFLQEWNEKGSTFAREINEMVAYAKEHGWDKVEKKDISDQRDHLTPDVLAALRQANKDNTVDTFRESCPPSFAPLVKVISEKGQAIVDLHFVGDNKLVFITGAPYEKRQGYLWESDTNTLTAMDEAVVSIGKSPRGNCFAVAANNRIVTTYGWNGTALYEFTYPELDITTLIPYNDGSMVLLVSQQGIYIVDEQACTLLHPLLGEDEYDDEELDEEDLDDEEGDDLDEEDELDEEGEEDLDEEEDDEDEEDDDDDDDFDEDELDTEIDMEHAALSPDNTLLCVGDQDSFHKIVTSNGYYAVRPASEYSHFAIFSKDGKQLLLNSCHMYHGATLTVPTDNLEAKPKTINESDRVYAGVATEQGYIWGDANGYIKAYDYNGDFLWQHFIGGTISGMAISDDETTLYVGSYSGTLHQLKLGAGHRDTHTIGTGNHYEECRWFLWKDEPTPLKW